MRPGRLATFLFSLASLSLSHFRFPISLSYFPLGYFPIFTFLFSLSYFPLVYFPIFAFLFHFPISRLGYFPIFTFLFPVSVLSSGLLSILCLRLHVRLRWRVHERGGDF